MTRILMAWALALTIFASGSTVAKAEDCGALGWLIGCSADIERDKVEMDAALEQQNLLLQNNTQQLNYNVRMADIAANQQTAVTLDQQRNESLERLTAIRTASNERIAGINAQANAVVSANIANAQIAAQNYAASNNQLLIVLAVVLVVVGVPVGVWLYKDQRKERRRSEYLLLAAQCGAQVEDMGNALVVYHEGRRAVVRL